ncbi:hypothetical protein H9P43_007829 [Blastocladiella emersonii ATCC 22665]|nr:hypothetical protein H9P43_007829 [Blastocladiella emersonii ATCC 22665]
MASTESTPTPPPLLPPGTATDAPPALAATPPPLRTRAEAVSWLHEVLAPRIAIAAAPDVAALLAEHGIASLSHFLAPFASAAVQLRDPSSGYTMSIPDFCVRFVEVARVEDPRVVAAADDLLADVVRNPGGVVGGPEWAVPAAEGYATPWYDAFRHWLPHTFTAAEHEALDHPVALVFAVSTRNADPVGTIGRLFNQVAALPAFERGWMDPNVFRHFLLVHDGNPDDEPCRRVADAVQRTFGPHISVIPFKPVPSGDTVTTENYWADADRTAAVLTRYLPDHSATPTAQPQQQVRVYPSAVAAARNFVHGLLNHSVVPFMERSSAHWNEHVAAPRRGITGRLFSASRKYFGSPSRTATTPSPSFGFGMGSASSSSPVNGAAAAAAPSYPHSAQEALLRRLADYAFMLRDYKLALQVYQSGARAFSGDKAWRHLAAANEMAAVCHALLGQWSDVDAAHETAVTTYTTRARMPHAAARATVLLTAIAGVEYPMIATGALVRAATVDTDSAAVRVALFLEQAAALYAGPLLRYRRKALIHLVLAGNRFTKSLLRTHAIRCYATARDLLPERWDAMFDHVHLALGRQFYQLGAYPSAIKEMLQLVHPGQTMVLEELVYLYSQHPPPPEEEWQDVDRPVPEIEVLGADTICVHESASWTVRFTNTMRIPISICSPTFLLPTSDPAVLAIDAGASVECGPLVATTATFTVRGLAPGTATLTHLVYRLHDMIPLRVPLAKPVTVTVTPPRPKLAVEWELPSVVFASQVQATRVTLTNTGFVETGKIVLDAAHPPLGNAMVTPGTAGPATVVLHVDPSTPLPATLQPGESAAVTLWWHWHAASVTVQWRYGAAGGKHVEQIPVAVTVVPLVHQAWTGWRNNVLVVAVEAQHQALAGTFAGPGFVASEPVTVPARQTLTHLLQAVEVADDVSALGGWPAWDGPSALLQASAAGATAAGSGGKALWFAWTLNTWRGFLPLALAPPAPLGLSLTHAPAASRLATVPLTLTLRNHCDGDWSLALRVEFTSDAALVIAGQVVHSLTLARGKSVTLTAAAFPVVAGVHDLAAAVVVTAAWADPRNGGRVLEASRWRVPIDPSYLRVEEDGRARDEDVAWSAAAAGVGAGVQEVVGRLEEVSLDANEEVKVEAPVASAVDPAPASVEPSAETETRTDDSELVEEDVAGSTESIQLGNGDGEPASEIEAVVEAPAPQVPAAEPTEPSAAEPPASAEEAKQQKHE